MGVDFFVRLKYLGCEGVNDATFVVGADGVEQDSVYVKDGSCGLAALKRFLYGDVGEVGYSFFLNFQAKLGGVAWAEGQVPGKFSFATHVGTIVYKWVWVKVGLTI